MSTVAQDQYAAAIVKLGALPTGSVRRGKLTELVFETAKSAEHLYKSLSSKNDFGLAGWDMTKVSVSDVRSSFFINTKLKMKKASDGSFRIEIPNIYAYENYVVRI